jgi:predicted nucleic acid-binding protein
MIVIVVDASALIVALVDTGEEGDTARRRLSTEDLAAPELIDLEVASVLRRLVSQARLSETRAENALTDLMDLPLVRSPHLLLLTRCWELRHNVSIYDAAYVALAEALQAPLVTGDARLSRASGPRCSIELLTPS